MRLGQMMTRCIRVPKAKASDAAYLWADGISQNTHISRGTMMHNHEAFRASTRVRPTKVKQASASIRQPSSDSETVLAKLSASHPA